jgi:NitT/TauT family transport system ATP-binding protein
MGLSGQDVEVSFGDLKALGPISLAVDVGQCVVLLGPSGCGKSTLLAALAGLQPISGGKIAKSTTPPGFVFQEPNLMPWASALDNVALPLVLAGVDRQDANQQARAALARVGLEDFARAKPRALSGGMRMRVALARALVTKPGVLLLDEPFAAIDELGRRALDDLVLSAKAKDDLTIVFVTHSVEEAVYLADTVLVMSPRPGRIVAEVSVPPVPRDPAFLVSDGFAKAVADVRRALNPSLEAAP